ncbi:MAG: hypothetical protein WBA53_07265 [Burkholderiaceae bacterium]
MRIRGSCHCGNIAFTLDWTPEPSAIPARACTCAFCRKHGGVWTACPAGTLNVAVGDASLVSRYAFETKTAEFHVCARCGVVPLATSTIDARDYAVVNVNTLEGIDRSMLVMSPVTFDGESVADRLARRTRNWIGNVRFTRADDNTAGRPGRTSD